MKSTVNVVRSTEDKQSKRRSWFWLVLNFAALIVSLATLFLATGAVRDPSSSLHGVWGSAFWTTYGPHLVLINFAALILSIAYNWRRSSAIFSLVTLLVVICATFGATVITTRIVSAAYEAGGYANPISGLWLSSMTADVPDETASFERDDGQTLRAAIFRPPQAQEDTPVLVYFHGGGFMIGSMLETSADLRWFADRGWLVITVEYRLWTDEVATWDLAPQDVACALAWVQSNAERYGGDIDQLTLLGDSAGGNLAINLAYAAARGEAQSPCGETVPVPDAVVVQYPAVDPLSIYEHGYPLSGFEPKMLMSGYIGGNPYELPERVQAISSYTYLSDMAPPTLIIAPEKDSLVPPWSVYRFADQARLAGVDVETVRIPFASHVYNQTAANSIGNQARRSITERYLAEQGLAPEQPE